MMVRFDAASSHMDNAAAYDDPATWDHVVGAGANLLVVWFKGYGGGNAKFNNIDLTYLGDAGGGVTVWYMVNPPSGTLGIEMDTAGGEHEAVAMSFFNGSVPTDLTQKIGVYPNADPVVTARDTRSLCADMCIGVAGHAAPTPVNGQTVRTNTADFLLGSTLQAPDPSANADVTMGWNGAGDLLSVTAVVINAAGEGLPAGMTPVVMH